MLSGAIKVSSDVWLVIFAGLVACLLRACTTLHPHSGQASPPMYGDYEAQRHWMEITTNIPVQQWYQPTLDNNLTYWGLDYPPLTAYHMFLCGKVAHLLNANYTKLHQSHGYESERHKSFMRTTVLLGDLFIYIPAIVAYFYWSSQGDDDDVTVTSTIRGDVTSTRHLSPSLSTILALLYPGLILIDHGHFQYNSISLGLLTYAILFIVKRHDVLASIFFCLALNYKQMELYHSLPFFFYLLSSCVPKPHQSNRSALWKLTKIASTVMLTFAIIWLPFLTDPSVFLSVIDRLFPVARGIFEDKVSNFWCVANIFYKFRNHYDNQEMMRFCLIATVTAILPSSLDLFLRPNVKKFNLALINSSMAFYLFSFQVHEKSILIVALPVILHFPRAPFVCFWFLLLSVFSMSPLLFRDNLMVATISLVAFYVTAFRICIEYSYRKATNQADGLTEYYRSLLHVLLDIEYKRASQMDLLKVTYRQIVKNRECLKQFVFHSVTLTSLIGCAILSVMLVTLEPPERYPDLYPLLISVYSAVHFFGFFIYFNYKQVKINQQFDDIRNVKIKGD